MTDIDTLAERVAAIERAVTDGEATDGLPEAAAFDRRIADAEATLSDLDGRVAELEAATQALRGYVGGVRAVNRDVERRADLALAKAEALEADANRGGPGLAVERLALDGAGVRPAGSDRSSSAVPASSGSTAATTGTDRDGAAGIGGVDESEAVGTREEVDSTEGDPAGRVAADAGLADRIRRIADDVRNAP